MYVSNTSFSAELKGNYCWIRKTDSSVAFDSMLSSSAIKSVEKVLLNSTEKTYEQVSNELIRIRGAKFEGRID